MASDVAVDQVLAGYAKAAAEIVLRFEAIDPDELYTPVVDLLPTLPARIVDIGAGTGRDAAWLARKGYEVTAVEPVAALREAGKGLHAERDIEWIDDRLPDLRVLRAAGRCFDCILLSAVWQHLDDRDRNRAMSHLAALTVPGGVLLMSVRKGPGAADRHIHPVSVATTVSLAREAGFKVVREQQAESLGEANRRAGVRWTWLGFIRA